MHDDGAGLDRERILARAVERGLVETGAALSDQEICQLIFAPGFSTADAVSDLSARGVSMDVVRRNINDLGGMNHFMLPEGDGSWGGTRLSLATRYGSFAMEHLINDILSHGGEKSRLAWIRHRSGLPSLVL